MKKISGEDLQREKHDMLFPLGGIRNGPLIVADGIQSAENVGSIIRLGEAFAARSITFLSDSPYKLPKIKKTATSGSYSRVSWEVITKKTFLEDVRLLQETIEPQLRLPHIAIELTDESVTLGEEGCSLPKDCCLIIGNESHGISQEVLDVCTASIEIPMWGVNNSLNVSHALAIVLWEWRKQYPK